MMEDISIESFLETSKKIDSKVKLGSYYLVNCLPINFPLKKFGVSNLDITYSIPSDINKNLLEGNLDIAPISTAFYLANKDKLILLKGLSISSNYDVGSVLLFSKCPIEQLNNKKISVPPISCTSVKLLKLILIETIGNDQNIVVSEANNDVTELFETFDAVLLIGDIAIKNKYFEKIIQRFKVYDLGKLWFDLTNLPMTFAVWAARKEFYEENKQLVENVNELLVKAKTLGLGCYLNLITDIASKTLEIDAALTRDYLCNKLNYELNAKIIESIEIFNSKILRYGL